MKRKAIFLDRDGVLNQAIVRNGKPYSPKTAEELIIPEDILPALQILKAAGYLLICVTNQPDVARGANRKENIEAIHSKLMSVLPLDDVLVCYHDDNDHCSCRKPLPGLLLQAAKDYDVDLKNSVMIGDRWKDIEAGQKAQCQTIWIDQHYEEPAPKEPADFIAKNMTEATTWILQITANK